MRPTDAKPRTESTVFREHESGEPDATSHPDGAFEYGVLALAVVIVAVSLYLSLKYLMAPGEKDDAHIKRTILEEES